MKKILILTTLAALVLPAAGALAQVEPAPYVIIHYDRVDPAQMQAWEKNAKDWAVAFGEAELGAEWAWRAYSSGFEYAWVGDMPDFAYLDGQEARNKQLAEALGGEKLAQLEAEGAPAVREHYNEIWKYEPEMSYQPEGFSPEGMKAINVVTVSVKAAMGKEYRELVKEAIAALETIEAPVNWFAYSTPFGAGSFTYVIWGESRADLHSGPQMGALMTQALGEEKANEMFGRYFTTVAHEEERDWMVRADLAYMGAAPMEEKDEGGE